jgi:hypothetical protein
MALSLNSMHFVKNYVMHAASSRILNLRGKEPEMLWWIAVQNIQH